MNSNPLEDVPLGIFLQQVLEPNEIDVVIETGDSHQSPNYEHIRLMPMGRIEMSSLRDVLIFYYGQIGHKTSILESDGRHFKLECRTGDAKLMVDSCFNFEGEEHVEIIVT